MKALIDPVYSLNFRKAIVTVYLNMHFKMDLCFSAIVFFFFFRQTVASHYNVDEDDQHFWIS